MRGNFIACILWVALIVSARGSMVEIAVTPDSLEHDGFRFAVSATPTKEGADFEVTITWKKQGQMRLQPGAALCIISSTPGSLGMLSVKAVDTVKIDLKQADHAWKADLSVPHDLLKKQGLRLIFSAGVDDVENGREIMMPSVNSYEVKLGDFLKP
jgi:hypothetical protein